MTPSPFPISDPRVCYLCGEPLFDRSEGRAGAHDACVHEWRAQIDARTCYVCGEFLDEEAPDNAAHPACLDRLDEEGEEPPISPPLYREIEDVPILDRIDPWGTA